jgi:signal transduction histidine kinase
MKLWRSLRGRLVLSYLFLALSVLLVVAVVFSAVISVYAAQVQAQRLSEYTRQAHTLVAESREPPDQLLPRLKRLFPEFDVTFVPVKVRPAPELSQIHDFYNEPAPPVLVLELKQHPPPLSFIVPVYENRLLVGYLQFLMIDSGAPVIKTLLGKVLLVLAAALVLAGLVGWWLSRSLVRPLHRLATATAAVTAGDFQQTVDPVGVQELDQVTVQFNAMVLRLRESFRLLAAERDMARRFAADAAHELKTPVTALRTYQEVVAERPERLHQVLPALARQVQRVEGIVAGLTKMARLGEETGVTLVSGDVARVVREALPGWIALAEEYNHTLEVTGHDDPVPARLDARLLEMALSNLVENACKFTPPGGRIWVAVDRGDGVATISVTDNGPGIAPEELPYIFERFHRGVGTQNIPGSGLGLAIVQAAVERMAGSVDVDSHPGRGSRFTIRLTAP